MSWQPIKVMAHKGLWSRRRQGGMGLGYLLLLISLFTLVSSYMLKNSSALTGNAASAQYMAAASDLDRAATDLSVRMAQLRMTYGAGAAVRIENGQLVSPTAAFPPMTLPPMPASSALSGWAMSENNRLQLPVTGDLLPVATTTITNAVCAKFNATHIRADSPTLTSAGNVYGGTTYAVSNPGFNAGAPSALFCVENEAGGNALVLHAFMS